MCSGRLEAQEMNVAVFPMHAWDARGGSAFLNPYVLNQGLSGRSVWVFLFFFKFFFKKNLFKFI
jgi:hypothetical protein